ncbi:unnamed protein product [Mycena citricolor]|uniref:Uncharacterized protein n=1 Tax=Mycena citricolor TaxID=2018698 RepID=A0AAD2GRT0_9AGAR|nr:unnamed protein product [Mycena citricolor]
MSTLPHHARSIRGRRSFTGNHPLLPAMKPVLASRVPRVPTYTFLKWSFGRGSVIWKIWPAVLLHTAFAAAIVYVWVATGRVLQIPNVMLTVMGVVIGFVISYRAGSGYDRYWMGRTAWTDIIRNSRTMGRLIWYHVPPRLSPSDAPHQTSPQESAKVMAEKRMALDLVEAFAFALKHHLRAELGIYYEDLYDLVRPLHDFEDTNTHFTVANAVPAPVSTEPAAAPPTAASTSSPVAAGPVASSSSLSTTHASKRPSVAAAVASTTSIHRPLLPASNEPPKDDVLRLVSKDVIPFAGVATSIGRWFRSFWAVQKLDAHEARHKDRSSRMRTWSGPIHPDGLKQLEEIEIGENLPEEILRCLSEWVSVLEERGTVPGASLGAILGGIATFEISLTALEHILTTPLPFVYSVHIRHVVWMYLFLLPFQLVSSFGWHTVPAVSVGAFVYLGFVAAGEEIEQPFGYDDNDLDLDMFCRDIIQADLTRLKKARCLNAWFPPAPATGADQKPSNGAHRRDTLGGNLYAASLASLSDLVALDADEDEDENDGSDETEEDGVQEGNLVDVR